MAIRPEPVEQVLEETTLCVIANVDEILEEGEELPLPERETPGSRDIGGALAHQVVRLTVQEVLRGEAEVGSSLVAKKPVGDYVLIPDIDGPFLLRQEADDWEILGRYGPDTWPAQRIRAALGANKSG